MLKRNIVGNMIIVCTVVGDVQLTVTVYKGQVTIAIKTTCMTCTDGNQVTIINIVNRSRSVTEQCGSVGKHLVVT